MQNLKLLVFIKKKPLRMRFQMLSKNTRGNFARNHYFQCELKEISVDNNREGSPPPPSPRQPPPPHTHILLLKSTGLLSHYITLYKLESDDKDFLNYLKI